MNRYLYSSSIYKKRPWLIDNEKLLISENKARILRQQLCAPDMTNAQINSYIKAEKSFKDNLQNRTIYSGINPWLQGEWAAEERNEQNS